MVEGTNSGNALYEGFLALILSASETWDESKRAWLSRHDYSGLGMVIQATAKDLVGAGAIALRTNSAPDAAFGHWRQVACLKDDVLEGCKARVLLTDAEANAISGADFVAGDFLYIQYGLLLAGLREQLAEVRGFHELPFVRMRGEGEAQPNAMAMEARIMFAAWEGDQAMVEDLAAALERHYERFKLSSVYAALWRAVARRDSAALNQHLEAAEEAYRKSARRKVEDPWGGGKALNAAMFDVYTTCVLKIARDCGMSWEYGNDFTRQIWPALVLDCWA